MRGQATMVTVVLLLFSACSTPSVSHDISAVISSPTEESRAELQKVVSKALNGIEVKLADHALTQSSLLTIERRPIRESQGRRIMGRELGMPHQFRLVKNGSKCILVRLSDDSRWELPKTNCIAE